MGITEEMVDAGGRALAESQGADFDGPLREDYRRMARVVLRPSAPLIAAQALRLSPEDVENAVAALRAVAEDEREPERYRESYGRSLAVFEALKGAP